MAGRTLPAGLVLSLALLLACSSADTGPSASATDTPRPETAIGLGSAHTCAITAAGTAWCWGRNSAGQLGDGTNIPHAVPGPVTAPAGVTFTQISAANNGTCAVTSNHALYCWGVIPPATTPIMSPQLWSGSLQVQSVSLGWYMGCALDLSGSAWCWGQNTSGQLGTGDSTSSTTLRAVGGGVRFQSVSVGLASVCGRSVSGTAYCWGNNTQRTTGTAGGPTFVTTPTPVQGGLTFTSVVTGATLSCGIVGSGQGFCWGQSYYGSGGFGNDTDISGTTPATYAAPTTIIGGQVFKALAPGTGNDVFVSSCALGTDGVAWCWGVNNSGQLGTTTPLSGACNVSGGFYPCTNAPVRVTTTERFVFIASGQETACGITSTHALLCWGRNFYGEVGDATTTDRPVPTQVQGGLILP